MLVATRSGVASVSALRVSLCTLECLCPLLHLILVIFARRELMPHPLCASFQTVLVYTSGTVAVFWKNALCVLGGRGERPGLPSRSSRVAAASESLESPLFVASLGADTDMPRPLIL